MMSLVSLELAAKHVRTDLADDADLLTLYLGAAEQTSVDYLGRKVYAAQDELDAAVAAGTAGEFPMLANDSIRAAILLTLGHLYANREDVIVGVSASEMPRGARDLLRPHRIIPGV